MPLLVYVVGVASPHVAIGTSAVAISASALGNKWRCVAVFAAAGVLGAFAGADVAKALDGQKLLALFGIVMVVIGVVMLRKREGRGNPDVRLASESSCPFFSGSASLSAWSPGSSGSAADS